MKPIEQKGRQRGTIADGVNGKRATHAIRNHGEDLQRGQRKDIAGNRAAELVRAELDYVQVRLSRGIEYAVQVAAKVVVLQLHRHQANHGGD